MKIEDLGEPFPLELPQNDDGNCAQAPPQMRILMVDDHPENLTVLEAVLGDLNLDLVRANSGEEALRHILRSDFALILLDVKMPGIDGFETARLIRQRNRSACTPIIFLTAYQPDERQIFEGYQSGAVDYISKPIVAQVLRSKVAVFTELFDKTRQLQRLNETLEMQVAVRTLELRQAEEKFRHIFEGAMDGIYQVNESHWYTIANPALAAILGYSEPDILVHSAGLIRHSLYVDASEYDRLCSELGDKGAVSCFESRMRRRDGVIIWVSESARLMTDTKGRVIGHEGMLRDITDRKRAEDEIAAKNKDLQTLLYVTSHDFKEPLRGILGYTKELAEADPPVSGEEARPQLERIIALARRLGMLIDNVGTLIQARQISADMAEVDGESLVQQSLSTLRRRIDETQAQITIAPGLPMLLVNERWIVHALINLIFNALKFVAPGKAPEVEIAAVPPDKAPCSKGIVIRDRGIGVPEKHRHRIFGLFKRAVGHDVEGTGAGLAIVAQIVKGHGGSVWVEAREGGGSEFYLTLPDCSIAQSGAVCARQAKPSPQGI